MDSSKTTRIISIESRPKKDCFVVVVIVFKVVVVHVVVFVVLGLVVIAVVVLGLLFVVDDVVFRI